jgi:hypothetical protein
MTGSASACGDSKNKTASASGSCRVSKTATTASAQPAAKTAIAPAAAVVAAPAAVVAAPAAPAAPAGYRALPGFTQPAPAVAGLMAFLDPETGQLTGPINGFTVPDDVARMFAAPVELTPVTLPDGSVMLDLQGTLQDYYVLTIDPMGRRTIRCVQNPRQVQAPAAPVILPYAER